MAALQSRAVRGGKEGRQVRVLGEPFLVATPERVAKGVYHGRPNVGAHAWILRFLAPDFHADGGAYPVDQISVPAGSQAHRLWENGGRSEPGHAVRSLRAGVEPGQAEGFDGGGMLMKQCDLLLQCEA